MQVVLLQGCTSDTRGTGGDLTTEHACIAQRIAHVGETSNVECAAAGLYKYYPRDRHRPGDGIATTLYAPPKRR